MPLLAVAAPLWLAIHLGIAGTILRRAIVAIIGEAAFRAGFSVLSLLSLVFLVWAYSLTPTTSVWVAPGWLRWVLLCAMLPAFVLFVASFSRNPTLMGASSLAAERPGGIIRITRHPMMCSFVIWAGLHIIGTGDTSSIVFFATLLITPLAGMPSIDAKLARRDPPAWQALSAVTSIVPFLAIFQGRNRLRLREIGWRTPAIALTAWFVLLILHPWLFGVAPVVW